MSKIYKTCNPTIKFWNYEFNNKLLDGVTLLKVTSGVIWTQPNIYIYIYIQIMHYIFSIWSQMKRVQILYDKRFF